MLADTIHAELVRLQVHPVNLSVSSDDNLLVALQGSLLRYWSLPPRLDGQWVLAQLRGLSDAAGPEVVMNTLAAACEGRVSDGAGDTDTQVRLFGPHGDTGSPRENRVG